MKSFLNEVYEGNLLEGFERSLWWFFLHSKVCERSLWWFFYIVKFVKEVFGDFFYIIKFVKEVFRGIWVGRRKDEYLKGYGGWEDREKKREGEEEEREGKEEMRGEEA